MIGKLLKKLKKYSMKNSSSNILTFFYCKIFQSFAVYLCFFSSISYSEIVSIPATVNIIPISTTGEKDTISMTCEVIPISITGSDDGVKTYIRKDRNEAEINAMEKAVEQAGIEIQSDTLINNKILQYQYLPYKIKSILLPGYKIHDLGYNDNGVYKVVLIGKMFIDRMCIENKPTTGIPEEGNLFKFKIEYKTKEATPSKVPIKVNHSSSHISTKLNEDELEKELSTADINPQVKDEIRKLPKQNFFLANSNIRYTSQPIDIINKYLKLRYSNYASIIEKNSYKLRYLISGLKNEILDNSNKWERIQLDVYILNSDKFLLYIDAFYATGLGDKEPPLSGYIDMEQKHFSELSYYVKKLKYEIETFFQRYE